MKKFIKHVLCIAGFIGCGIALWAHEFWLQPTHFFVPLGGTIQLYLFVGENFTGESWANRSTRLEKLIHYQPHKAADITKRLQADDTTVCKLQFTEAGTHLLYLHSKPSLIELAAEKFNAYLAEDGLDNILELRKQKHEIDKPAKERYERFAKTYIQCGNIYTPMEAVDTTAALNMQLLNNPYLINKDRTLPLQVFFNGRPLKNKKVVAWQKNKDGNFLGKTSYLTDADGKILFSTQYKGIWMLSTVHMIPAADTSYHYHSYWGTITFEIK